MKEIKLPYTQVYLRGSRGESNAAEYKTGCHSLVTPSQNFSGIDLDIGSLPQNESACP